MRMLGSGLSDADHHADALVVKEAELSLLRRLGAPESSILGTQNNLANSYQKLGRLEEAMCLRRDVYSGDLRLYGVQHQNSLVDAFNYATSLCQLKRFEEAKALMRETIPVARRVLGESHDLTLRMKDVYAKVLYEDPSATLDDLHEAVTTFEDLERIARRVLGGAHPLTVDIELRLREARAALAARDGGVSAIRDAVEAMTSGGA